MPTWLWPIIVAGVVGIFLYETIKASESVARVFGRIGKAIHNRAPYRTAKRVEHIEQVLERTTDKLECATTYLALDAEYHHDAEIIIAESYPMLFKLLPPRLSFSVFSQKWAEGWRP